MDGDSGPRGLKRMLNDEEGNEINTLSFWYPETLAHALDSTEIWASTSTP